jgi:hypothetical protein
MPMALFSVTGIRLPERFLALTVKFPIACLNKKQIRHIENLFCRLNIPEFTAYAPQVIKRQSEPYAAGISFLKQSAGL